MGKLVLEEEPVSLDLPANVFIKPYLESGDDLMGLSRYNEVVHPGTAQSEQLACLENNGVRRWLTGLDEFAPEIRMIQNDAERKIRIQEIRKTVAQLEKDLNSNPVDPKDPQFWDKIQKVHPRNHEFWSTVELRCSNDDMPLFPQKNPMDLILLCAIKAGGFNMVAKTWEDAKASSRPPKFYLDEVRSTVVKKAAPIRQVNKAIAMLDDLDDRDKQKLFYVMKNIDTNAVQYREDTPSEILYMNADTFIRGLGSDKNKTRASEIFIEACKTPTEELKYKAIVRDAIYFKYIALKGDGMYWEMDNNIMLGRNLVECVEFLKAPVNDKVLVHLLNKVEYHWKQKL